MEKNTDADTAHTRSYDFTKQEQTSLSSTQAITTHNLPYRVLPLFEKQCCERTHVGKHSLRSNETLASRWRRYVDLCVTRGRQVETSPHWFPKNEDLHFYNYYVHCDAPRQRSLSGRRKRLKDKMSSYDNRFRQTKCNKTSRQKSPSKKLKYVSTF